MSRHETIQRGAWRVRVYEFRGDGQPRIERESGFRTRELADGYYATLHVPGDATVSRQKTLEERAPGASRFRALACEPMEPSS